MVHVCTKPLLATGLPDNHQSGDFTRHGPPAPDAPGPECAGVVKPTRREHSYLGYVGSQEARTAGGKDCAIPEPTRKSFDLTASWTKTASA